VGKPLDGEGLAQERFRTRQLLHGDGKVEIETHHGLGVRIHCLITDDAKADVVLGQQGDQPIEEIRSVESHRLPERSGTHGSLTLTASIPDGRRTGRLQLTT
jgi:hypothetical protein